jgi:hypothetical protein
MGWRWWKSHGGKLLWLRINALNSRTDARLTIPIARLRRIVPVCCSLLIILSLSGTALRAQTKPQQDFATLSAKANAARDANRLDQAGALYKQVLALRPSWTKGW